MLVARRSPAPFLLLALVTISVASAATPARAQQPEPIGPFVVDLRGSLARYGQDENLARAFRLSPSDLPPRGLGLDVGGHWYFLRWRAITFGVGGSLQVSRGSHQTSADPQRGIRQGPAVRTQVQTFAPQLSLNFGSGRGWSYLSGGVMPVRLKLDINDVAQLTRRTKTINYGGGARWFIKPHLAFTFDLRMYGMSPLAQDEQFPGLPRLTLLVFSAGVSMK